MIRTPPIKFKQTRMRTALPSANVLKAQDTPPTGKSSTVAATGIFENETESEESDCSGKCIDSLTKKSDQHPGKTSGESGPTSSTPSGTEKVRTIGKLDSSVFKPFGSARNVSMSRSSMSDTSESDGRGCIVPRWSGKPKLWHTGCEWRQSSPM